MIHFLELLFLLSWLFKAIWRGITWVVASLLMIVLEAWRLLTMFARDYPSMAAEIAWSIALLVISGYSGSRLGLVSWISYALVGVLVWAVVITIALDRDKASILPDSAVARLIAARGGMRLVLLRNALLLTVMATVNSPLIPTIATEIGRLYFSVIDQSRAQ